MVLLDKSDPDYSDYMAIEMLKANKLEFASDDDYWEYVEKKVSERTRARDENARKILTSCKRNLRFKER